MWRHRLRRPACFKCPKCPKSISMPDVPNLAFGTWCSKVDVPKALSGFMQSAHLSRIQLWDVVTRWQNPESAFWDISMLSKVPKLTFGIPFGTSLHFGVTTILVVSHDGSDKQRSCHQEHAKETRMLFGSCIRLLSALLMLVSGQQTFRIQAVWPPVRPSSIPQRPCPSMQARRGTLY